MKTFPHRRRPMTATLSLIGLFAFCLIGCHAQSPDASRSADPDHASDVATSDQRGLLAPSKPIDPPQEDPADSASALRPCTIQIDCDGILHQISSDHFSDWAEQMRTSKIERVQLSMPYDPGAERGIELWRLSKWDSLRALDLSEFRGMNVVMTGPESWTTAGAARSFRSVTELWLSYDLSPGIGEFPSLHNVHVDARNPDAEDRARKKLPHAKLQTFRTQRIPAAAPRPIRFARQLDQIMTTDRIQETSVIAISRPIEPKIYHRLSSVSGLRRLSVSMDESLESLSPLAGLRHLTHLDLEDCPNLTRVTGLQKLTQLKHLRILQSPARLGPNDLGSLSELTSLSLGWLTRQQDLTPALASTKLQRLQLVGFSGVDYSRLRSLADLRVLLISHDPELSDLTAFTEFGHLERLIILNCPGVSLLELVDLQSRLPDCSIQFDYRPH